ncbi:MAG: ATP synthase F1 subunit epsilon [Puniceicoccales bacterium]|jgi:F-type H+-transporting ATPase subunit epsilon|nr:ATP synthase F1 subunit epsilon [Puniceicoccales bacterium]
MKLEVSTPEGLIFEEEVDAVTVLTRDGELGILPGHIPMASIILPGVLRFRRGSNEESMAVDRGFLYMQKNTLCVIVDAAVRVVDVDDAEAENARKRAEQALEEAKEKHMDAAEIAQLEAKVRYQIAKQRVKRTVSP